MIKLCLSGIMLVYLTIISGCASLPGSYLVTIDSINNKEKIDSKKCVIIPALRDVYSEDLQFKEFAMYLERALTEKGYNVVQNSKNADVAVFLAYGTGDIRDDLFFFDMPLNENNESAKIFGNLSFYGTPVTYQDSFGYLQNDNLAKTASSSQFAYDQPSQSNSTYIVLRAYDLKYFRKSHKEKQLWRTDIITTGSKGDLRYDFPFLIAAAVPYLGEDTKHKVDVGITENDKEILKIKGR